jgi:uncharacterized Zn finger protein (UPF0148 family)
MVDVSNYEDQMLEKYCEEHDMFFVKNAVGTFICPFCEAST